MQVRFYCRKMLLVETRISKFHRNGTAVVIINKNFAKQNMDHQLLCTCVINIGLFLGRPLENNNVKVSKFCAVWNTSNMTMNFSCFQFDFKTQLEITADGDSKLF